MDADVLIVGAGLAGLRCAQVLELSGRRCVLLEASDAVGGRVRSRQIDDVIIDEGFQLANPAYPELRLAGLTKAIEWRRFAPVLRFVGPPDAEVVDPRYAPLRALRSLRSTGLKARDLVGLLRAARAAAAPSRSIISAHPMNAREGFRRCGISEGVLDDLIAPFLTGVVLDDGLEVPWSYVRFLLKSFLKDRPATTPAGLAELPRVLASRLVASDVRLSTPVLEVGATWVRTGEETLHARCVVVATDAHRAAQLVPGLSEPSWRSQTTWWWRTPRVYQGAEIRILRPTTLLTGVLDLAAVAPERCPGRSLLAAASNAVASDDETPRVRETVARLYNLQLSDVELVEVTRIARALPVCPSGRALPSQFGEIFLAGDYLTTPSTQGALRSGRRAAEAVLSHLAS